MEWADLGPGRWLRREKKSSNKIESTRLSARQAGDGSHPEAADAVAQGAQCHNRAGGRHGSPAKLETTTSRCRRQRMRAWPGSGRPAGSSWLGLIVLLWSLCLPCALPVNSPGDNTWYVPRIVCCYFLLLCLHEVSILLKTSGLCDIIRRISNIEYRKRERNFVY